MKRFQFRFIHALALSAYLFTTGCTSDGTEEEVEDENMIHERSEDNSEVAALPSAEQAAAEANKTSAEGDSGDGTVDQSRTGEVQQLPSEQQMAAVEDAAVGSETPSTYAVTQPAVPESPAAESPTASTAGAETESPVAAAVAAESTTAPAESPALPEAASPSAEGIPTLADVVADSEAAAAPSNEIAKPEGKKKKGKKSARGKRSKRGGGTASIAPSGDGKVFVVRPGDTLGTIAMMLYGTSKRWPELAAKNNLSARDRIFPGDSIMYSPEASTAAFEAKWEGLNKSTVNVGRGETLSAIAARVMGKAAYWKMIWQWNADTIADPNKIAVGQELKYVATSDMNAALSGGNNGSEAH